MITWRNAVMLVPTILIRVPLLLVLRTLYVIGQWAYHAEEYVPFGLKRPGK